MPSEALKSVIPSAAFAVISLNNRNSSFTCLRSVMTLTTSCHTLLPSGRRVGLEEMSLQRVSSWMMQHPSHRNGVFVIYAWSLSRINRSTSHRHQRGLVAIFDNSDYWFRWDFCSLFSLFSSDTQADFSLEMLSAFKFISYWKRLSVLMISKICYH